MPGYRASKVGKSTVCGPRSAFYGLLFAIVSCATTSNARRPAPIGTRSLPFAVDSLRSSTPAAGVTHHFIYTRQGPWAIHVLDVMLARCYAAVAVKGGSSAIGRTRTSDLMRQLGRTRDVVGGVNADFFLFAPPGVPANALVTSGRVLHPPSQQPVFAVDSSGVPHILTLEVRGGGTFAIDDTALAHVSLMPLHPLEAVGGRPRLLRDSTIVPDVDTVGQAGFATGRHPRTAVGFGSVRGRRTGRILLVVVDGRQARWSDGMTLRELAELMRSLGAREALNLDGGGSTTMVVRDPYTRGLEVVNRPSDASGERPVGDALAVIAGCRR